MVDLNNQSLFKLMNERMDYLQQRQKVLAQNVANADTPNYRAHDMRHVDFLQALRRETHRAQPVLTQANHLPSIREAATFHVDAQKRAYETSPDKNGVVLEEQMMKVAQTQTDFSTTTVLYKKYIDMLKTALSSRA